jgi:2-polyprenyl-3-methyl-5-hydroxy-6-metoxy-1,4-benzoquinol methylase
MLGVSGEPAAGSGTMSRTGQTSPSCPVCGGHALTPVFDPPHLRCRGCDLVFRNQAGAQEQVRGEFEGIYRDPEEEQWVQERRHPLYAAFLARYHPLPGKNRLLDVGCGSGNFLRLARAANWDVMGTEIAEAAVQAARAAGLSVRLGPLPTADLPDSSFDVVTLWNVLDFIPDPLEQVRAARHLLVPGGLLVARVSNLTFQWAVYRASRQLRVWPRLAALLAKQHFMSQVGFNARSLGCTLERAGFERIEITNSPPTYGDPYRTLPWGGDTALRVVKRLVYGAAWMMAACSGGRVLWGSSLLATALKGGGPAARGD